MAVQLFVPTFSVDECLVHIRECLEKGWTGLGFKTVEFEDAWCRFTGLPHAHFLGSATHGLHLAVNIFREIGDWQDGDEIITTPLTFVSTNHAILYERLTPVFADVDEYLCLDPASVLERITPRTRAVMFVGLGGSTGQLEEVARICRERGLKLILDAAHMAGTRLHGRTPTADCVVYSFQAVKNLPTADSGMICFPSAELDDICRKKAWMGINKDTFARTSTAGAYRWMYDVEYVGYKYHGNSIMASIGLVELNRLDRDNAYRRQLAAWYDDGFADADHIQRVPLPAGCETARHLYQIQVDNRDELMLALNGAEIYPGVHYRDNRCYRMYAEEHDSCPAATKASERILSLPLHIRLQRDDVAKVVEAVRRYS